MDENLIISSVSELEILDNSDLVKEFDSKQESMENFNNAPDRNIMSVNNNCKNPDTRITLPYLTKFEKARLLGARSLQISMGAPILIENNKETDSLEIAARELTERKIPISIRRYLPSGQYEDWKLDELIID